MISEFPGELEDRLKETMTKVTNTDGHIILVVNGLHTIVGAGATKGTMDAGKLFKTMLGQGELQFIGATTLDQYHKCIEKDPALECLFQEVCVAQPTVEDTVSILRGLKTMYELHHGVCISDSASMEAAYIADRHISGQFLPDKAIDLLDETAAKLKMAEKPVMTNGQSIKEKTGGMQLENQQVQDIVLTRAGEWRYGSLNTLHHQLEDAEEMGKLRSGKSIPRKEVTRNDIAEIVSVRTGIPLAESLKEKIFNLEEELYKRVVGQDPAVYLVAKAIIRFCSGLSDPDHPVGSFIFRGPTGVGKTELAIALDSCLFTNETALVRVDMGNPEKVATQLTESVGRRPFSILLFDDIDTAHQDVFDVILRILDEGKLKDSNDRIVRFNNVVIIMTTNKKSTFSLEFKNRVDEYITFEHLDRGDINDIVRLQLDRLQKRLVKHNIREFVENQLAEHFLWGDFVEGEKLKIDTVVYVSAELTYPQEELRLTPMLMCLPFCLMFVAKWKTCFFHYPNGYPLFFFIHDYVRVNCSINFLKCSIS